MSLNFCENNIGFYTGALKICKKNVAEWISYRFDAIDPYKRCSHDKVELSKSILIRF